MEVKQDDGGQAFPLAVDCSPGTRVEHQVGMSLRDWFAGQVMIGVLPFSARQTEEWRKMSAEDRRRQMAEEAYALADALLNARKP